MPQADHSVCNAGIALVALGSNAASSAEVCRGIVRDALSRMREMPQVASLRQSGHYRTPCFPAGAGPDYVNAAVRLETGLGPEALLEALHGIEAEFGRRRVTRWGARTLDLDLLDHSGLVRPDPGAYAAWRDLPSARQAQEAPERLILPHPRIQDRAFVLIPLADVAPDWHHPVSGRSVADMIAALPVAEREAIRRL